MICGFVSLVSVPKFVCLFVIEGFRNSLRQNTFRVWVSFAALAVV
jgi:hypothetical protein